MWFLLCVICVVAVCFFDCSLLTIVVVAVAVCYLQYNFIVTIVDAERSSSAEHEDSRGFHNIIYMYTPPNRQSQFKRKRDRATHKHIRNGMAFGVRWAFNSYRRKISYFRALEANGVVLRMLACSKSQVHHKVTVNN